jgi:mRNA-degrading endonuclease HigB of HigAB toxin-antitoxin module
MKNIKKSLFEEPFHMKFGLDNFFLTDNKIRHIIQVNGLKNLILLLHISNNEHFNQNDIHKNMEQNKRNTHNEYQILVHMNLVIELSLPNIHQVQKIIVDDLD